MHDKIRFYTAKLRNKTENPVPMKVTFSHNAIRNYTTPSKQHQFYEFDK